GLPVHAANTRLSPSPTVTSRGVRNRPNGTGFGWRGASAGRRANPGGDIPPRSRQGGAVRLRQREVGAPSPAAAVCHRPRPGAPGRVRRLRGGRRLPSRRTGGAGGVAVAGSRRRPAP